MSPTSIVSAVHSAATAPDHRHGAQQLSFGELGPSLHDTTFVIVDLETTGGSAEKDQITEIGAVKVRGGEILGEFATLVNPGRAIPPHIVQLTGITTAMVYRAPSIEQVLPSFLEFARGATLVAHNAGFDTGFLKSAAARCELPWTHSQPLCTVKLARRVLPRDEAPSVKLSALAEHFRIPHRPTHRALDDARATVDVLHALLERVGNQGIQSLAELKQYYPAVPDAVRRKRNLASHLPSGPGVYLFRGPSHEVLYVGTATNLYSRVRSYFTGSELRSRMREMVALAEQVDHVPCATSLEAGVRELRLLAAHAPPYNRKSKWPQRSWWVRLTDEPFPRLSVSRVPSPAALGPFPSRAAARTAAETIAESCGLRTCTHRLTSNDDHSEYCLPAPVGGCPAARQGPLRSADYNSVVAAASRVLAGTSDAPIAALKRRIDELAASEKFETAARLRDRAAQLGIALHRCHRLVALTGIEEIVAGRRDGLGGWDMAIIRYGRLAAAGKAPRGTSPLHVVDVLTRSAETVIADGTPLAGTHPEEVSLLVRWLGEGARIVRTTHAYSEPASGAGRHLAWCKQAQEGARQSQACL
ncbi:DEDD exonuclease domain-containing protein [Hoyosella sp. YIM 151337]|uniref:DEDD exonuclease domain-containing protein n=1 Tax=Hoyosella sp. YIM 151337 TaxID=2992742 RepID=UPI002235A97A|nr:DEDD exonuclease domain-containing protein [Hoyosella sp. YIM 151337]MCW4355388.1 DEDD exonuclease domain-containing protein [Hoyosella sp. YIM 151337]